MPKFPVADDLRVSAEIIPFPGQKPVPSMDVQIEAEQPGERLARALAMLEAAQAEQRQALCTWREAIEALSTSANGLNRSLETYQASLTDLRGT